MPNVTRIKKRNVTKNIRLFCIGYIGRCGGQVGDFLHGFSGLQFLSIPWGSSRNGPAVSHFTLFFRVLYVWIMENIFYYMEIPEDQVVKLITIKLTKSSIYLVDSNTTYAANHEKRSN